MGLRFGEEADGRRRSDSGSGCGSQREEEEEEGVGGRRRKEEGKRVRLKWRLASFRRTGSNSASVTSDASRLSGTRVASRDASRVGCEASRIMG